MDIKKFAVDPTSRLHLCDAQDAPMYATKEGSDEPDMSKPICVVLYGPGSKPYARAQAQQNNRMVDRLKRKGKSDETAERRAAEQADFLAGCTKEFENLEYDGLIGDELAKAVYADITIGFIADQVGKHLGDWANFSKVSTKSSDSSSNNQRG